MNKKISAMFILIISLLIYSQSHSQADPQNSSAQLKQDPTPPPQSTSQQPSSEMSVGRAAIALDIVDRVPQDTGTIFPAEVKRLYCYSEILNGEGGEIQHRWYWNDELLNSVSLKITSKRFRTYSAKTIFPHMKGKWRVAIVNSANEATLKWLEFTIE